MENKEPRQAQVITPDKKVFMNGNIMEKAIMYKGSLHYLFDRLEYPPEGGILLYYQGMPYPKKGFPYPEAIWANDVVKRMTRFFIVSVAGKEMALPAIGFLILPHRFKIKFFERMLTNYDRICDWLLFSHYLKDEHYTKVSQGIMLFVRSFMLHMGFSLAISGTLARTLATVIEYDDSYRLRIEDIISETSDYELRKNPRKELSRLFNIFHEREQSHAKEIIRSFSRLIWIIMLSGKVRKSFRSALSMINVSQMGLDNADRYHALLHDDYNFVGKPYADRKNMYIDIHTFSDCCHGGVIEKKIGDTFQTICGTCMKLCTWKQEFPPQVEVTGH